MQISRFVLKGMFGLTVFMPAIGAIPPAIAQDKVEQAKPTAKNQYPNHWATGDVTVIDDATQTFQISDYTVKVVQKQVGDKTVEVLERGVKRIQTFKLTPQTKVLREERDILADQLKVGDSISYISNKSFGVSLDTISSTAKVTSVSPLILELKGFKTNGFSWDSDTVAIVPQDNLFIATVKKSQEFKFTRITELYKSVFSVGRSVLVYPSWAPDSDPNEAARIAVENYRP